MQATPSPDGTLAPGVSPAGRNLPVAIASGLVLAVVFVAAVLWHPYAFLALLVVLVVAAALELDKALRSTGARPATPVALAAGVVAIVGAYTSGPGGQAVALVLLLLGATAWVLVARSESVAADLGATLLVALWVPFLASFGSLLLDRREGRWAVLAAVALTVTSDISAYAFGSRFGRRRLAPSVSPAKTWEGCAGGLATVLLVAAVVTARVPGFDLTTALVLGAAVFVAATVGDLAESLVKRDLGLKDLGGILPGHGGVMERADAVIFALPTAHLVLSVVRG